MGKWSINVLLGAAGSFPYLAVRRSLIPGSSPRTKNTIGLRSPRSGIAAAAAGASSRRQSCFAKSSSDDERANRLLLPSLLVGIDQGPGPGLGWPDDRLRAAVTELFEVVRFCVLNLRPKHARRRPFSILPE